VSSFNKRAASKDGLAPLCKACAAAWRESYREKAREYDRQRYAERRDLELARSHAYYQANRERISAKMKELYQANVDVMRQKAREWQRSNPDKVRVKLAERKASKLRANVGWDRDLDDLVTHEAAYLARIRSERLGVRFDVDHIVPLQSKKVCGLHNAHNLAVIPSSENYSKGNRWWPDMWATS